MAKITNKRCCITGGAGFIGTHLVKRLLHDGNEITVFDIVSPLTATLLNFFKLVPHVRYVQGDIRNPRDISFLLKSSFDFVFHLAAQPISVLSNIEPKQTMDINTGGTRNLCQLLTEASSPYLILASSACVFGIPDKGSSPLSENDKFGKVHFTYTESKRGAEQEVLNSKKLKFAIGRFVNVYGYGDRHFSRIIPKIVRQLLLSESELELTRNSSNILDFLYVDDAVEGLVALAEHIDSNQVQTQQPIYHFGIGKESALTTRYLVHKISQAFDGKTRTIKEPCPALEPTIEKYLDPGKANTELKWKAYTSLDEGLVNTINWYRDNINSIAHLEDTSIDYLNS